MNKVLIILNPAARGGRSGKLVERIRAFANGAEIRLTDGTGDARRFAKPSTLRRLSITSRVTGIHSIEPHAASRKESMPWLMIK